MQSEQVMMLAAKKKKGEEDVLYKTFCSICIFDSKGRNSSSYCSCPVAAQILHFNSLFSDKRLTTVIK